MKAARGQGDAPPELRLAFMCGDHLPEAGGVFDQDYKLYRTMQVLESVYRTVKAAPTYTGKKIHNMPSEMKRTIKWLQDIGEWKPGLVVDDG